jgi:threonine dehydrogenase-like Zn-dependent dehydrogenase
MKAVLFYGVGDIRVEEVPEPLLQEPTDAIVRLTASAICGTDLHFVRGSVSDVVPGTILGHEGVGIVEQVGKDVRNLSPGDRVVIASSIACGNCSYCRAGYYSQCDAANPNGKAAGTAFFGGPKTSGPFDGLQAEKARIPFANIGLVKLPDAITDDQALLISDIFPTGYFGAEMAEVGDGDTVAIFGCGAVGQFAIASARLLGAGRIFAIDRVEDRLEMARAQGAETINFDLEDPVETILRLTAGIGVDRAIDAVGVDADAPRHTNPGDTGDDHDHGPGNGNGHSKAAWQPGDRPDQVLDWAVRALDKAGTLAIIGVYPEDARSFPIGLAVNKNLTINMGNCPHRRYIPHLIELTVSGRIDPASILTRCEAMEDAVEAFGSFDRRDAGWIKVRLQPEAHFSRSGPRDESVDDEERLDEAIDESFPASDPPSISVPRYP